MHFRYGKQIIDVQLPEHIQWQTLEKPGSASPVQEQQVIANSIDRLMHLLYDQLQSIHTLLIIIPDHTRKCRLPLVLPLLMQRLQPYDLKTEFLVANGSHVEQPEAAIKELVGENIYNHYPVIQHDSRDDKNLAYYGVTDFGTEIFLNKKVREADYVLTIGGILYHYFAGFGGGPKMLLPGVAGYETIRINHRRTIDEQSGFFHKDCFEGNIITNPVYRDLAQVVQLVPNCISLQFALDVEGHIVFAEAGPVLPVQNRVCEKVKELYSLPIQHKADLVIAGAGGFPADVNLIQAHKAIHHAFQAVREQGVVVIFAECTEGIGSKTFMPYFTEKTSRDIGQRLLRDYMINGQTALSLKTKTEAAHIILVSLLDKDLVRQTGMIPCTSVAEAMQTAQCYLEGCSGKGYLFPAANLYVPHVTE